MSKARALVIVKEEVPKGGMLTYLERRDLGFMAEGDAPSSFRRAARKAFQETHGARYTILAANSPEKRVVSLVVAPRGSFAAPKRPGYIYRRRGTPAS